MRFDLISVLDPAIDTERMTLSEMRQYVDTRDTKLLEPYMMPGQRPTVFRCEEVQHELWESYVQSGGSEAEKYRRAFQAGVREVKNYVQDDGRVVGDWTPSSKGKLKVMDDADASRFPPRDREEIGMAIYHRSFLGPRIKLAYPLPPMSLSLLAQLRFRPADASQSELVQSNSKALSTDSGSDQSAPEPTQNDTSKRAGVSDSATAATATGTP